MKSILLVKKHLELVEMMFGLVNASFSLPEWQKMIFLVHLTEVSRIIESKKRLKKGRGSILYYVKVSATYRVDCIVS